MGTRRPVPRLRSCLVLVALAALAGSCAAPPQRPLRAHLPAVRHKMPSRPAGVAAKPAGQSSCPAEADATGLTEAQKAELFAQFDAWQGQHASINIAQRGAPASRTGLLACGTAP